MATFQIRYNPDHAGVGRLLHGAEMRATLHRAADDGKTYAESISPRETGEYARSFIVEDASYIGRRGGRRPEARLVNTAPYAVYVEYVDGHRVLGRTVDYIERGV